jgi:hypothetical protein
MRGPKNVDIILKEIQKDAFQGMPSTSSVVNAPRVGATIANNNNIVDIISRANSSSSSLDILNDPSESSTPTTKVAQRRKTVVPVVVSASETGIKQNKRGRKAIQV